MRTASIARLFALLLLSAVAASRATAGVLTVGPSGSNYPNIQSAVNAAAEGDTILVRAGSYAGFDVAAKSLDIVADPQGSVAITTAIVLHDHAAGQRVVLSGMSISTFNAIALRATNVAGALRFEALTSHTTYAPTGGHGAWLTSCSDVAFVGCDLTGGVPAHLGVAGAGLQASSSFVALYDCTLTGGPGYAGYHVGPGGSSMPPAPGGAGCALAGGSVLFLSGSQIAGGTGGTGVVGRRYPASLSGGPGGSGGTGAIVDGGSQVHSLDSPVQGGPGGQGGAAATSCGAPVGPTGPNGTDTSGSVSVLPGTRRKLVAPTHVREMNSVTLAVEGEAGDVVWVRIGNATDWQLVLPSFGVQLFGPVSRRALLGTLPGSGTLGASLYFGDLGPGVDSRTWHMQAVFRDVAGQTHLGSAAALVVLDQSF